MLDDEKQRQKEAEEHAQTDETGPDSGTGTAATAATVSRESGQRSLKEAVKKIIGLGQGDPPAGGAPMVPQASPVPKPGKDAMMRLHNERPLALLPQAPLMPFDPSSRNAYAIHYDFMDYLELVDETGRIIREDKKGYIRETTPKILNQINLRAQTFINQTTEPMSRRWRNRLDFSAAH